jgi:tetratricopeptide (TPR) repeat protein
MNEIEIAPRSKVNRYSLTIGLLALVVVLIVGLWFIFRPSTEVVKTADLHLGDAQLQEWNSLITQIENNIRTAEARRASAEELFKLYSQLGNEQYAIGAYDLAQKALLKAQKLLPENPTSYQDLYAVYVAMRNYPAALGVAKKSLELNSASIANWNNYIALQKNQFSMSTSDRLQLYEQALVKTGNAQEIVHGQALTYEEKADYVQAYTMYRALVDKYPENMEYRAGVERLVAKQSTKQ